MKFKKFIPMLILIPLVVAMVIFSQTSLSPEPLKTQIPNNPNSLEQLTRFQLAIELVDQAQIEMDFEDPSENQQYSTVRRAKANGDVERQEGEQALEEINKLIEAIPSLVDSEEFALIQSILAKEDINTQNLRSIDLDYNLKDGIQKTINIRFEEVHPEAKEPPVKNLETTQIIPNPQQLPEVQLDQQEPPEPSDSETDEEQEVPTEDTQEMLLSIG